MQDSQECTQRSFSLDASTKHPKHIQISPFFCFTSNAVGEVFLMELQCPGAAEAIGSSFLTVPIPDPLEGDDLALKRCL